MQALVTTCAAIVLLLVPVQFLVLPMNMSLTDVIGFALLPVCWFGLIQQRRPSWLPLFGVMWLLLLICGAAAVTAQDPGTSFAALLKEVYLYAWMVSICNVLTHADERGLRRILIVWLIGVYANGALIVAQFLDPSLLAAMNSSVAGVGKLDLYRPSGLMENSNAAALFQLTGFAPLLALRLGRTRLLVLGSALLLTTLGTGSMGATLAFATGLVAGLVGLIVLFRDWRTVIQFGLTTVVGAALLAAMVLVLMETIPELQQRVRYVLTGRGEGSAEGRFDIWSNGWQILNSDWRPLGVGPDCYRQLTGKELHNDVLAFTIERGLPGLLAFLAVLVVASRHAVQVAVWSARKGDRTALVFVSTMVAMLTVSATHEIFHQRPVWMVLALQEALWWRARCAMALQPAPAPSGNRGAFEGAAAVPEY